MLVPNKFENSIAYMHKKLFSGILIETALNPYNLRRAGLFLVSMNLVYLSIYVFVFFCLHCVAVCTNLVCVLVSLHLSISLSEQL